MILFWSRRFSEAQLFVWSLCSLCAKVDKERSSGHSGTASKMLEIRSSPWPSIHEHTERPTHTHPYIYICIYIYTHKWSLSCHNSLLIIDAINELKLILCHLQNFYLLLSSVQFCWERLLLSLLLSFNSWPSTYPFLPTLFFKLKEDHHLKV